PPSLPGNSLPALSVETCMPNRPGSTAVQEDLGGGDTGRGSAWAGAASIVVATAATARVRRIIYSPNPTARTVGRVTGKRVVAVSPSTVQSPSSGCGSDGPYTFTVRSTSLIVN